MREVSPSPFSDALNAVSAMFDELASEIQTANSGTVANALTKIAVKRVAGAVAASITTLQGGRFRTVSASDDAATRADHLQYQLGSGPCLDTIRHDTFYGPVDLCRDNRWPEYGPRVSHEVGFLSMVSYRLRSELQAEPVRASLNIYADQAAVFDRCAIAIGTLLARHGATTIAVQHQRDQAIHLAHALESSREIGIALGILMNEHKIPRAKAFDLLKTRSQNSNRKLRDVASSVVETGTLSW
jgi:ANTAR domain-containing protein